MLSLQGIITLLQDKKTNNAQLSNGTFYFGDPWEFGASNEITYPFMGVTLENTSLAGNIHTTTLQIFFCDLVHKDESNENKILSDLQNVALDIYSQVRYDLMYYYDAQVNDSVTLLDFTERFDDEVAGWAMTLNIEQFYDRSTCNTPNSGLNSGVVKIVDQDGNVLATLNPNSTYTVEVLQEVIDTINNNTGSIIDPIS